MIWYIEDLQRFRQEREELEALAGVVDWLKLYDWRIDGQARLICDVDLEAGNRAWSVSLEFPNHFPHSPPLVKPRGEAERWSTHQWGAGGELCLEHGPDNWHPSLTGADMVRSAHRLLEGETVRPGTHALGQVPSRHAMTIGQELRAHWARLVVTRNLSPLLHTIPLGEVWEGTLILSFLSSSMSAVVSSLIRPGREKWVDESVPKAFVEGGYERPLSAFRWPDGVALPSAASFRDFQHLVDAQRIELPDVGYVVIAYRDAVAAYLTDEGHDKVTMMSIIPSEAAAIRLDPDHDALRTRKVGLVGCGSLGSKLGVMLARSGVGRFLLVDDDVILPDNLVRNDLDWRDVGMFKTSALARRIELANAAADCKTREHRLGGQESGGSIETLIDSLAACDAIIDASADPTAFNYLSAAAHVGKRPMLWGEVFGGGFGGLIARHRPGIEPDPATMRRSIENWCGERGMPVEPAADYETRRGNQPLVADDADVSAIAAHLGRFTIDTLTARDSSRFPHSVYMIGLCQQWIFEQPFDIHPIDVGRAQPEQRAAVTEEIALEERKRVVELLFRRNAPDPAASDR